MQIQCVWRSVPSSFQAFLLRGSQWCEHAAEKGLTAAVLLLRCLLLLLSWLSADAGECLQEFAGHKGGVNALAAVAAAAAAGRQQQQQQHSLLLSAGKDHKLKLWDLGEAGTGAQQQQNGLNKKGSHRESSGTTSAVRCVAEYVGHTEGVQAVAAHPAGSWCCSGGWDGQLLLWKTGKGPCRLLQI